nr:PREDICTED: meiotic nuclear division protein 1 homolog isoform X2 [Tribolium castaneum]|eukprot:XP_015838167.1 PREDICTED: meiotic nuclear division protein 1 homolog isoform X2 [Tribolium castaneum]
MMVLLIRIRSGVPSTFGLFPEITEITGRVSEKRYRRAKNTFYPNYSKLLNAKKRKLNELQTKLESSTKKLKLIDETMEKAQVGKENWDDSQILKEIEKLEKQKEKFESLSKSHTDTQNLKLMQSEIKPVKEAANRWTDNIFAVKSWCKRKFMMEDKVLNKQFGIPGDLDYLA